MKRKILKALPFLAIVAGSIFINSSLASKSMAQQHNMFDPSNEEVVQSFLNIAYGADAGNIFGERTHLSRLTRSLQIGLVGNAAAPASNLARRMANIVAGTTNLDVSFIKEGNPNFFVLVSSNPLEELKTNLKVILDKTLSGDAAKLNRLVPSSKTPDKCWYFPFWEDATQTSIISGLVVIDASAGEIVTWSCMVEGLSRVLGLFGELPPGVWSRFSKDEPFVDLTTQDMWFLKALYDPRMQRQFTRDEAGKVALQIMRELRPNK